MDLKDRSNSTKGGGKGPSLGSFLFASLILGALRLSDPEGAHWDVHN